MRALFFQRSARCKRHIVSTSARAAREAEFLEGDGYFYGAKQETLALSMHTIRSLEGGRGDLEFAISRGGCHCVQHLGKACRGVSPKDFQLVGA